MVENHRRCSFSNFKLRAHFLNLGGLLLYRPGETWNLILMLRDRRFLFRGLVKQDRRNVLQ